MERNDGEIWTEVSEAVSEAECSNEVCLARIFQVLYRDEQTERAIATGELAEEDFKGDDILSWQDYHEYATILKSRNFSIVPAFDGFVEEQWSEVRQLMKIPMAEDMASQRQLDNKYWSLWLLKDEWKTLQKVIDEGRGDQDMLKGIVAGYKEEFDVVRAEMEAAGAGVLPVWE